MVLINLREEKGYDAWNSCLFLWLSDLREFRAISISVEFAFQENISYVIEREEIVHSFEKEKFRNSKLKQFELFLLFLQCDIRDEGCLELIQTSDSNWGRFPNLT